MDYAAKIEKDKDMGYVVSFPDLPYVNACGETREEAIKQQADKELKKKEEKEKRKKQEEEEKQKKEEVNNQLPENNEKNNENKEEIDLKEVNEQNKDDKTESNENGENANIQQIKEQSNVRPRPVLKSLSSSSNINKNTQNAKYELEIKFWKKNRANEKVNNDNNVNLSHASGNNQSISSDGHF